MSIYKKFNYSFLKTDPKVASVLEAIANIYSWQTKDSTRKDSFPSIYTELEKQAKFDSIKSSNAIEGIVTTDKAIKSIIQNNIDSLDHNELEISGYKDALAFIHNNYKTLDVSENTILKLHEMLLIKVKPWMAGKYKDVDNLIAEVKDNGDKSIRYIPLPANEVKEAMNALINAFKIAQSDSDINKLLLIPCFILDFLCIHPFIDGNGRISRLLTLLLLYKYGYDVGKYVSIEKGIEIDRNGYYDNLYKSSLNWDINENSPWPFIKHFIFILARCYRHLDNIFLNVSISKGNKSLRIENAIFNSLYPLSKQDIHKHIPDVSISTIEAVLSKLLKQNKIEKIGKTKVVRYKPNYNKKTNENSKNK